MPQLAAKPRWLVLNKLDLVPEDERERRGARRSSRRCAGRSRCSRISAINGDGCRELIFAIQDWLDAHPAAHAAPVDEALPVVVSPAPVAPRRRRNAEAEEP